MRAEHRGSEQKGGSHAQPGTAPRPGPARTHPAAEEDMEDVLPAVAVHEGVVVEHGGGRGFLALGLRGLVGEVIGPVVPACGMGTGPSAPCWGTHGPHGQQGGRFCALPLKK